MNYLVVCQVVLLLVYIKVVKEHKTPLKWSLKFYSNVLKDYHTPVNYMYKILAGFFI